MFFDKLSNAAPETSDDGYTITTSQLVVTASDGFLAHSTDADGDALQIVGAKIASGNGTLTWNKDGSYVLNVAPDFKGEIDIDYQVTDGKSGAEGSNSIVVPFGGEFLVNTETQDWQGSPAVVGLTGGGSATIWKSSSNLIKMQLLDAEGHESGAEASVNTQILGSVYKPQIASLSNGNVAVVWSYDYLFSKSPNDHADLRLQMFHADGSKLGTEIPIFSNGISGSIPQPAIASFQDGNFIVVWKNEVDTKSGSLIAQIFDPNGVKIGSQIDVCFTQTNASAPTIATLENGGFVVGWQNSSDYTIHVQVFAADGAKSGSEIELAQTSMSQYPKITGLANGGFVCAWD